MSSRGWWFSNLRNNFNLLKIAILTTIKKKKKTLLALHLQVNMPSSTPALSTATSPLTCFPSSAKSSQSALHSLLFPAFPRSSLPHCNWTCPTTIVLLLHDQPPLWCPNPWALNKWTSSLTLWHQAAYHPWNGPHWVSWRSNNTISWVACKQKFLTVPEPGSPGPKHQQCLLRTYFLVHG